MSIGVVGFGAGGHARVLLDILLEDPAHPVVALLDPDAARWGERLFGVPILGGDDRIAEAKALGAGRFFVGAGTTGSLGLRRRLFALGCASGLEPQEILHPSAVLSRRAAWGPGLSAMAGAVLNAGAQVGADVVLNTGAIVEHDCQVADHVFLAPGALVMGGVSIGEGAFLGAGCVIRQGIAIGAGALVAAGAVVVRDVLAGACVGGIPAHPLPR